MASSSSSHQQNRELNAFSGMEPPGKRRKVSESSTLYDVFINHRGPDVKYTLARKFYNSFEGLGIRAFLDSEEKELGNSFTSIIETAIYSAKVHIAIFSEGYAESPWCLAELVLMLQSTAKIIPVFYKVKPSDLRYIETGAYAEAFIKYTEKGRYLEKLDEWKEALLSLSLIAGEEFYNDGDFQNILAAVQKEMRRKTSLHVAEYPVGLNNLVEDFQRRCLDELVQDFDNQCGQEEGEHKAKVVGIFGMGGLGKTTLAKELFNRKNSNYKRASFLFDVREESAKGQLHCLQLRLLKDLFDDRNLSFTSTEDGMSHLKDRLRRSPLLNVLIVVDNVDNVKQLHDLLVMDILEQSANSLVIVTTSDVRVLKTAGITVGYNLKGMDRRYARELFCWHAFGQDHPCSGYEELSDDFVDVCGGLPLSLQVLGRHVRGNTPSSWSSELVKVRKMLHQDVKQTLRISFESLDDEEKQVFMDVACFFLGKPKSIAERVWEGSGWQAQHALETLKAKCLVEEKEREILSLDINEELVLGMHDHLRDLGRELALELSPPSRPWCPQDLKLLESTGFRNVLAKPNFRCFHSIFDQSMSSQITFFLGQSNSCFETSASVLWLQLDSNYTKLPSIPSWIPLQKLQYLKVRRGQLRTLWENRIQAPSQLKELHIWKTSLDEFPDFRGISDSLENVYLDARGLPIQGLSLLESLSMNLSSLCISFSTLKGEQASIKRGQRVLYESLVILNFKFNGELVWINGNGPMRGLEKLEITGQIFVSKILISGIHYPNLECIKLHYMENLIEVDLTRIKTLNCLDIRNCQKLKRLVATSDLPNLVQLNISQCPELEKITIVDCEHSKTVSGTLNLRNPVESKVKYCKELLVSNYLNSVSGVSSFRKLAQLNISECPELEELSLAHMICLEKITIEKCNYLKSVSGISNLAKLVELEFSDCDQLEFEYLCLSGMKCLERITFERNVTVKYFELDGCQNLKTTKFCCEKLVELRIRGCPVLEEIPAFIGPSCVERITIDGCGSAYLDLHGCHNLKSVSVNLNSKWLNISNCEKIWNITLPTALMSLSVQGCRDLQRVAATGDLMEVNELIISDCPQLEQLPSLSSVDKIKKFEIKDCEKMQNIALPTRLFTLSIQGCRDLQRVAATSDLMEVIELIISDYPQLEQLPSLSSVDKMEKFEIKDCEKIQNITLPKRLFTLSVQGCRDLQRVAATGDLMEVYELIISDCPQLEQLPSLSSVDKIKKFEIKDCEKIQNITLPTRLFTLSIQGCRDLQRVAATGDLMEVNELIISDCPQLEQLPSLSSVDKMEKFEIKDCEKIQNITLPVGLLSLSVQRCRDLRRVAATGDLMQVNELIISDCPQLEQLPSLSSVDEIKKYEIKDCEKIQNITLPEGPVSLSVQRCRDLRRVAATRDVMLLRELIISDCPQLEQLPSLSTLRFLKKIVIDCCGKLQNISGIEELRVRE